MSKLLALESTEMFGSVAVWDGSRLLFEQTLQKRSAQGLAPAIAEVLAVVGWQPSELDAVAVGIGPGSFTGLRVGLVTAKMLAYALKKPIFGVETLLALAAGVGFSETMPRPDTVFAAVDAQRGEVIARRFAISANPEELPTAEGEAELMPLDRWWAAGASGAGEGGAILYTGPVLSRVAERAPTSVRLAELKLWFPKASVIGRIAMGRLERGECDDLGSLGPIYSRPSAAEEKKLRIKN